MASGLAFVSGVGCVVCRMADMMGLRMPFYIIEGNSGTRR